MVPNGVMVPNLLVDVINMTPNEELAWAAGILEGEGCFSTTISRPNRRCVDLKMTDKDIVERVAAVFNVGHVYIHKSAVDRARGKKPAWLWRVQARKDAETVMRAVLPFMGVRRAKRIHELLPCISETKQPCTKTFDRSKIQSDTVTMSDYKFLDGEDYGIKGYAEKNADSAPGLNRPISESCDITKGCRHSGIGGTEQSIDSIQGSSDVIRLTGQGPGPALGPESKRIDPPGTKKN